MTNKTVSALLKALGLGVAVLSSACAAVSVSDNASRGSPKIFGGTRLNAAALSNDRDTLRQFSHYGITPPEHPGLDLPLSFAGDVILLPYAIGYIVTEPLVGR